MAECFCGCGETVRFARKRASRFGAQTDALLERLRGVGGEAAEGLVREGEDYRRFWLAMAHGADVPAGALAGSLDYRRSFHEWEDRAKGLSRGT